MCILRDRPWPCRDFCFKILFTVFLLDNFACTSYGRRVSVMRTNHRKIRHCTKRHWAKHWASRHHEHSHHARSCSSTLNDFLILYMIRWISSVPQCSPSNVSFNFSHKFGATKLRDYFLELCSVTVFIFLRMPWLFLDLVGKTVWKISKPKLKKNNDKIRIKIVALVTPVYKSSERNVYSIYRSICYFCPSVFF